MKRGIGRSGVSGDGNGNGTPTLPPAVITPMSRYRQPDPPPRTKLAWAGRILLWALAAILVLGAALSGGTYLYFNREVSAVRAHTADVKIAQKRLSIPLPGQPTIALIAGYDHRANEGKGTPSRSDTVMLVRVDPQLKAISMLSFPRDMIVNVTCPDKPAFRGKINAAYTECGARGTLETVKDLTGLPINYLVTVNFHGFKQIVDKLGGVWMDIDRRYYNKNTGSIATNYADIDLHAGYQRLNGENALSFVRFRHTDSDFYRVIRQQMFVKALKQQIQQNFSPFKLPGIVGAITKNVEVGAGGDGLKGKTVLSYALFAYGLPAGHFFQAKIQGLSGYSSVTTSDANLQDAIREFTTPDVEAPTKATDVTLGRKIRSAAPRPQDTTLLVLNGNGVSGSAATAGYAFARRGYQIVVPPAGQPANAPTFDYFHSTVYYDPARVGAKEAATKVANLFGDADVAELTATVPSYGAMLVAVVGQTFHGSIAPAPVDETPKPQKANVFFDPSMSHNLVRDAQRQLPFKAMVPTVMERSSVPDMEEPNRVYWIDKKHRSLRLVYRTGGTEYWGIEQTDWKDAPILGGKNSTHLLKGRPYDLYYSGPHLHMVVLRWNGASYWVINTLQDTLSNETMLAIAKGLRTYGR